METEIGTKPRISVSDLAKVNGLIAIRAILVQWTAIGAAAMVAIWLDRWWLYLLAIVVIATRQHALLVLMHDGAHRLLVQRRFGNEIVSELLLAFPLFVSTTLYRSHHLLHHRFLNSDADPDVVDSREAHSRPGWLLIFLADAMGRGFWKLFRSGSEFSMLKYVTGGSAVRHLVPAWSFCAFVVMWTVVVVALTLVHGWLTFLLLWIVPMFTVLGLILHVRAVAEHVGCEPVPTLAGTRTVIPGVVERFLFAPVNVNYHLAHHLFPGVPATRLARLHARLWEDASFRRNAHMTNGYLIGSASVLAEVAGNGTPNDR